MKYKDNIDPFFRKMYGLMRSRPEIFKIKRLRGMRGYCNDDGTEIVVDHRDEILSTLIHEVIHYLHPDWSEKTVQAAERYIINKTSARRATNILKQFSQLL